MLRFFLFSFFSTTLWAAQLQIHIPKLLKGNNPKYGAMNGRLGELIISVCNNQTCYDSDGASNAPYWLQKKWDLEEVLKKNTTINPSLTLELDLDENNTYSYFIHHDRNKDGLVDNIKCFFVKPLDGMAFSKNQDPQKLKRKPRWSEVSFIFEAGDVHTVHMIYMCD